ncbi:type VI secretion system tip protein VgrG, partial [Malaciobacter molluscorum LMG 25693]
GANGISFKCGSNILTVDASGIHFNTQNFVDNSANGGVSVEDVVTEGDIINLRITNHYGTTITKQLENTLFIQADSLLKDGRSVDVILKGLNTNGEIIAQEIKTTTIQKNRILQEFDIEKLKKDNNLEEDAIKKYSGEINV